VELVTVQRQKEPRRLLLPFFKESRSKLLNLDPVIRRIVDRALEEKAFLKEMGEACFLFSPEPRGISSIILLGLGPERKCTLETLRRAFGSLARRLHNREGLGELVLCLDTPSISSRLSRLGWEASAQAITLAWRLGSYRYDVYKTSSKERKEPTPLVLSWLPRKRGGQLPSREAEASILTGVKRGQILGEAVNYARDLSNAPANEVYPEVLAARAKDLAKRCGLSIQVLQKRDLVREGMGALLGVAQGSDKPPCLIVLKYEPKGKAKGTIAWVGKAITFDSGGLSIKPAKGMEEMKFDMAGGAAVLGAMMAVSKLRPPFKVVGILPSTENVIGGSAMRPGDILKSASGKTIEVVNTDAEGRLILADALHYAQRFQPDYMVDFATLTGACLIALGTQISGLVGNDRAFTRKVFDAGERSGERLWELPLYDEFVDQTKSAVADLKNSMGRNAGTITAAAFLSQFVGRKRWCHVDIAGTAWAEKDSGCFLQGATGVGVRLAVELLEGLSGKE
jgi:leucyl aminopeptidase